MRKFVSIDLDVEPGPDETMICKFYHLIEQHELGKPILAVVSEHLKKHGIKIGNGTIMDAIILTAPSSTKNNEGERVPEMHQTMKGNQWYFGMRGNVGVDSIERIIHSVEVAPANVRDSQKVEDLPHGRETKVWGDSAYQGQKEAINKAAPNTKDMNNKRAARDNRLTSVDHSKNLTKSKVRAKGEHPFLIIKNIFGFSHVSYRGIAKNKTKFEVLCALANLYIKHRFLIPQCSYEALNEPRNLNRAK